MGKNLDKAIAQAQLTTKDQTKVNNSIIAAILANENPTLLEVNMAADLTAQKMDQLRQDRDINPEIYGRLFYIFSDIQRQRAEGRIFGLWADLRAFWDIYTGRDEEENFLAQAAKVGANVSTIEPIIRGVKSTKYNPKRKTK